MGLNEVGESVVVVPSVSLDRIDERGGTLLQAYEERFLFLLLLLRQPRLRMVYVTSMPIAPTAIEYYLALLPGVIPSHARSRLHLVHVGDASGRPLTEKLAGASEAARAHPRAGAGPSPVPPHPVQHHGPRAGPGPGAGHPDVRRRPAAVPAGHQVRMPQAVRRGGRASPAGLRGPVQPRRCRGRPRAAAGRASGCQRGAREAQRGRVGRGQRAGRPPGPAATRCAPGARGADRPGRGHELRAADDRAGPVPREAR